MIDYYTFSINTTTNTQHLDIGKLRHAVASKQIANGSTLPIAELPGTTDFDKELEMMAKGPEHITMTLSDDWEVTFTKPIFFIFFDVKLDSLHAGNPDERNND